MLSHPLTAEQQIDAVIDQIEAALLAVGKVNDKVARICDGVIELAVNEFDALDAALILSLRSPLDAGQANATLMHGAIRKYAEHNVADLLEQFGLTDDAARHDAVIGKAEAA